MKKLFRNFGLSMTLGTLFLLTWVAQLVAQWMEFTDTQASHGDPVLVGDFFSEFLARTFENWQSEFLQLFAMVVLTSFLIHKGSAESKDSSDQVQQSLSRIEKRLQTVEEQVPQKSGAKS